jgi:hypothetical protein
MSFTSGGVRELDKHASSWMHVTNAFARLPHMCHTTQSNVVNVGTRDKGHVSCHHNLPQNFSWGPDHLQGQVVCSHSSSPSATWCSSSLCSIPLARSSGYQPNFQSVICFNISYAEFLGGYSAFPFRVLCDCHWLGLVVIPF